MHFQFTHPEFLLLGPFLLGWLIWWFRQSDVQIQPWRRWLAFTLRLIVVTAALLSVAGIQWLMPKEGMNVFFLLDRSDSVPSQQQDAARRFVNEAAELKESDDKAGVVVFGSEAAIETSAAKHLQLDQENVLAVVGSERTDVASAIRLGTAAFPETGQKRLVLVSDGNENIGDAMTALMSANPLGVTLDVIPVGVEREQDVTVTKLGLPARVKEGSTFEVKIFLESDRAQKAKVRLYRNDQPLGDQEVELAAGKNLFSFPQQLNDTGFYSYKAYVETPGDKLPENNQASGFINVQGEPRVLFLAADPAKDQPLIAALNQAELNVSVGGIEGIPETLAEWSSYDAVFISNLAAGDLGRDSLSLLESAVSDFGVGLVCVGGENTYAAGGYRGTALERVLPVNMELDSKKVLPNGAMVLVMHGMEFNNGNQVARDCAQGVLESLGPEDELGVILWDGNERWLFELAKVGDKSRMRQAIAGMNQGDLVSFQGMMDESHKALKASSANLKHIIVFSDGDPGRPSAETMNSIVSDRITVTTVLISGHAGPETMEWMAYMGKGRFYDVNNAANLPQIFIKEAAVILKAAIFEEPFQPKMVAASELLRGINPGDFPQLLGYVGSTPKSRAETPMETHKGDPLLAHWQFGLGRAVAFTSDAQSRWAKNWLGWDKYQQFWSQIARWSLRRVENAEFATEVSIEQGIGNVVVEALDQQGEYRNFLNLQAVVVSPKGERQTVRLQQKGPGRYEANFPTKEVGSYLLNLMEIQDGQLVGAQVVGTSVNYSPEFNDTTPNLPLLRRLAESGGGKMLDPASVTDNPFQLNRLKTFQPHDLWEWLLQLAIVLFVVDVGVRRISIEREQWEKARAWVTHTVLFWKSRPQPAETEESLSALLARRDKVREHHIKPTAAPDPSLFEPDQPTEFKLPDEEAAPPLPESPAEETPAREEDQPSTTSRLLAAKRRARKNADGEK